MSAILVVGLAGTTCTGKTTVAKKVIKSVADENSKVRFQIVHQDEFYRPDDQTPPLPALNHYDFDCPEAINFDSMDKKIQDILQKWNSSDDGHEKSILIIEGSMIFQYEPILRMCAKRFYFFNSYEACKRIRDTRAYEPPDVPGYFDLCVWPASVKFENAARSISHEFPMEFLNADDVKNEKNFLKVYLSIRKWLSRDWLMLTSEELRLEQITRFVTDPIDGAVSIFCGVTRETFQGKTVARLEYEAYDEMAYSEMHKLCDLVRSKWPEIDRIAIHHRLSVVPVSESSVIIAVSSPHRKEAQAACSFAIDHLKAHVPIWKKEIYNDGTSVWKDNASCHVNENTS